MNFNKNKNKELADDIKIVESIKALALDMIDAAGSGHPGIVLGAAPIIYTLFAKHLNLNPADPEWANRDRFVLSAGHGSALLYSTLYLAGYDIKSTELSKFRQINSILPGHPELGMTPGVETTTGPLGQGIATAVGMALSERYLRGLLDTEIPKQNIINHYTYVLCGDGDLMEGISYEATSFAGAQKLNKLIVLYDSNDVTLDGPLQKSFKEDVLSRFNAQGWHTQLVKDGNDIKAIDAAIAKAKQANAPSIIEIKTIIGHGSKNAGKESVHGNPLEKSDYLDIKEKFGIRDIPFTASKDSTINFRNQIAARCDNLYGTWTNNLGNLGVSRNEFVTGILDVFLHKKNKIEFLADKFTVPENYSADMRDANNTVMNIIGDKSLFFLGGGADITRSTKTIQNKDVDQTPMNPIGKNIFFGVREHAMAAIMNGMALYGIRPYGSTFLAFSDYMKPAIRMSALMDLPVTYVFTHDSIYNGPDGATHQPIEQLASLRTVPGIAVYRPADISEIIGSWKCILDNNGPSVLILSKNKQEKLNNTSPLEVSKGAYIVRKEINRLDGIIVATGSEVETAIKVSIALYQKGFDIRVVSMPCINIFETMGASYHETILPLGSKIITLEASNDPIWYKFASNNKFVLKLDDFGYSGKPEDVLYKMEFDLETLTDKIEKLLK